MVTGLTNYPNASSPNTMLYFDFNANGIANEAALSVGDSSGGVFINSNGQWKLAGINYAVDSPWSYTGSASDPGFNADIFDARGLYYQDSSHNWVQVPPSYPVAVPGASYASDISSCLGWIGSTVPGLLSQYFSGTHVWDQGTTTKWAYQPNGPYNQNWNSGSNAVFEGAAGTWTVSGTISSVNSISFTTDGYTLGGTGTITLVGSGGGITTGAGSNTISCMIAGSMGLTKLGPGTLILGGQRLQRHHNRERRHAAA